MTDDARHPAESPEPLDLLIASLPRQSLLAVVKAHDGLARVVFQGFTARLATLGRPLVRQRLERELAHDPALATEVFSLWKHLFSDLLTVLNAPDFVPSPDALRPLLAAYGAVPLRYALLHADREEVRARAEHLPEPEEEASPAPEVIAAPADRKQAEQTAALRKQHREAARQAEQAVRERDALAREVARLEKQLARATQVEEELRKRQRADAEHLQREERRARKAQEEAEALKKRVQRLERAAAAPSPPPPPPPMPPTAPPIEGRASAAIVEAIRLLQSALAETPAPPAVENAPAPRAAKKVAPEPTLTLAGRKKQEVTPASLLAALARNDEGLVLSARDALAHLAPAREEEMLARFSVAGVARAVLSAPLRPAVIDGSNVANMSPQRRARLVYLEQLRRAAWEEGYFPVLIIVDASLRHQIDRPEELMTLVERGEILMAPAGTAADALIIEEAAARNAVIITNDRLADWPAAKALEKRHAVLRDGVVSLGAFHTSSLWFQ